MALLSLHVGPGVVVALDLARFAKLGLSRSDALGEVGGLSQALVVVERLESLEGDLAVGPSDLSDAPASPLSQAVARRAPVAGGAVAAVGAELRGADGGAAGLRSAAARVGCQRFAKRVMPDVEFSAVSLRQDVLLEKPGAVELATHDQRIVGAKRVVQVGATLREAMNLYVATG